MPYRCSNQGGKWMLQKQSGDKWTNVSKHASKGMCQKAIKAIGASKQEEAQNKINLKLDGFIGDFENSLESVEFQLSSLEARETLNISISSNGGSYIQALKIFDRLSQHKGRKNIRISPVAGSAAAVIALVPNAEVSIPENGLLFHHSAQIAPDEAKNPEELRKMADELEIVGSTLITMLVGRTGKPEEEIKDMLDVGTWFTAQQALDFGLVDKIIPLNRKRVNVSNLVVPEQIVAHIKTLNARSERMALKDVCGELKLEITDEMEDEALEAVIVNRVGDLLKELEVAKKERKPEKAATKLPAAILNILVKDRDMDITRLVETGKVIPAVADKLREQFAKKDAILNCVNEEGEGIDGFDAVIAALKENEAVINFGGKTKIPLHKEGEPQESGLVRNAKARGAK